MTQEEQAAADAAKKALEEATAKSEELAKRVTFLESEAKSAFKARDEVKDKLRGYEEDEKKRKEAELTEVDKLKAQVSDAQKQLEAAQGKAQEWDKYQSDKKDAIKAGLGDKWDDSYKNLPIEALEKLAAQLNAANPNGPEKPSKSKVSVTWEGALQSSEVMTEYLKLAPEVQAQLRAEYESKKSIRN